MRFFLILGWMVFLFCFAASPPASAQENDSEVLRKLDVDQRIDNAIGPISKALSDFVFFPVTILGEKVPVVLILLAGTAVFLTCFFGFINFRAFKLALRTVRGKYSSRKDPGEITHFQALSAALSATVGIGNIGGVAIAIGIGGPGAVFWMILIGIFGMTSKFCECTLGVRYRQIDRQGKVHGGAMYYLRDGIKERFAGKSVRKALGALGSILAVLFALACIGGALGAGNMYQVNQAHAQFSATFGLFQESKIVFGILFAVLVGLVIIGGIVWIARVTEILVPFMCAIYLLASVVVLLSHFSEIPAAIGVIISSAFSTEAAGGGFLGALIQGIKRGVFSNEAGVGSAPIAHAAVKTDKPASEGLVALLEPFVDTVVVCSTTALVIVVTGMWRIDANVEAAPINARTQVSQTAPTKELPPGTLLQVARVKQEDQKWKKQTWSKVRAQDGGEGWVFSEDLVAETEAMNVFGIVPNFFKQLFSPADALAEEEAKVITHLGDEAKELKTSPGQESEAAATVPAKMPVTELEKWSQVIVRGEDDGEETFWVRDADLMQRTGDKAGIWLTSQAFEKVIGWFPILLSIAVLLFAFSTMISWSYYGEQAVGYLTGNNKVVNLIYKLAFCACIVVGASASLGKVLALSDALYFSMVVPNLIGLYLLLPVVRKELRRYREHVAAVDKESNPNT